MKAKIYFNEKQLIYLRARQPTKVVIAGRGFGKSVLIAGDSFLAMRELPRAKFFLSSTTYDQILTKTMPAIKSKWSDLGLVEDVHYVIGKIPPKSWARPYSPPESYKNVLSVFNGFCIEFLSMDRPDKARGGSYDGGWIDEAALVKKEHYTRVLLPSIRGNRHRFNSFRHQQVSILTSVPWRSRGQWTLDFEQKAKDNPDKYLFLEATTYDNIDVIGIAGIQRMKEELSPLEFDVEVLNKRIRKVTDGFYVSFDDERHVYDPTHYYDENNQGIFTMGTSGIMPDLLIEMSLDFSGVFSGLTLWQDRDGEEYCDDALFVDATGKIHDLIKQFTDKYLWHRYKFIRVWGEPRGHDTNPIGDSIYQQIQSLLNEAGWTVEICVPARRTTSHLDRFNYINAALSELPTSPIPKVNFNSETTKDVILALQLTRKRADFSKVKTDEKDPNFPQQHAPHYTDTVDYYLVQKHVLQLAGTNQSGDATVI